MKSAPWGCHRLFDKLTQLVCGPLSGMRELAVIVVVERVHYSLRNGQPPVG